MAFRAKDTKLEQGRELASRLFDRKLKDLLAFESAERDSYLRDFPLLGPEEFADVLQQVIQAKQTQQEMMGWRILPHDLTVIALVVATAIGGLQAGIISAIGVLVLFESLFQVFFRSDWYRWLSLTSWLTYPAYAVFAYLLWREGLSLPLIIAGVAAAWVGTHLIGAVVRIPMRLWVDAKTNAEELKRSMPKT